MKKTIILFALGVVLATGASAADRTGDAGFETAKRIKGSGTLVTRTQPAPVFDALKTSRSVTVTLVAGGDRIVVEADDNLIDYVTVATDGRTLCVSFDSRIQPSQAHIAVTVPTDGNLRLLKATSSSHIISEVPLTGREAALEASSSADIVAAVNADRCRLEASSSADIRAGIRSVCCSVKASSSADVTAAIVTDKCEVECSSSADITLTGSADECVAACSSSADYEAPKFVVKTYDIRTSSSSDADIHCTERLTAHASSSGRIVYRGDCTVEKSVSSSGRISKK